MLEDELRGRTVVLERTFSILGYDIRRVDASGSGVGEPIATIKAGSRGPRTWGLGVYEDERLVIGVRTPVGEGFAPVSLVVDGDDNILCMFQRGKLGTGHWRIFDPHWHDLGSIERRSPAGMLVLRKLLNILFLESVPLPFRYSLLAGGVEVGSFWRTKQPRRRYLLDLTQDPGGRLNPLLALGIAISLAELEGRARRAG